MGCEEGEVRTWAGKVSKGQILPGLVKQVGKFGPCPWSNGEASVNFRESSDYICLLCEFNIYESNYDHLDYRLV